MNHAVGVRELTRCQVMKLDLRGLLQARESNRYDWYRAENLISGRWVFKHMHLFPKLRFVVVDDIKHFGERNMIEDTRDSALANFQVDGAGEMPPSTSGGLGGDSAPDIELVVFSAARCRDFDIRNTLFLSFASNLWFLDLSYTARDEGWVRKFETMRLPNLRVLRLQGMRFTDSDFQRIVNRLTRHDNLWSLDVSHNLISDAMIDAILLNLVLVNMPRRPRSSDQHPNDLHLYYEDAPVYAFKSNHERLINEGIVPLRQDGKCQFIHYIEKNGHLATRYAPILEQGDIVTRITGLTHLYLSGNRFTSDGIRRLLELSNRFQVLDIGSVRAEPFPTLPGCWTFAQLRSVSPLRSTSGTRLEKLRIHHSIVTCTPTVLNMDGRTETESSELKITSEIIGLEQSHYGHIFDPNENNRLSHLTLTGIPARSRGFVPLKIIEFLRLCAAQEARIKQIRDSHGSPRRNSPRLLSGLRVLTLEFAPRFTQFATSPSVSGDIDADRFLAETVRDFSFFGSTSPPRASSPPPEASPSLLDVVAQLKMFRESEAGCQWTGEVRVSYAKD